MMKEDADADEFQAVPQDPPNTFQQFHDVFVVRGSVQAIKCNFETGDVEFRLFGGSADALTTRVTPVTHLEVALKAFAAGENWKNPPVVAPAPAPVAPYRLHDKVVAKDRNGKWYLGQITNVEQAPQNCYLVTFDGFGYEWDIMQCASNIRRRLVEPLKPNDLVPGTKYLYNGHHNGKRCDEGIAGEVIGYPIPERIVVQALL